MNAPKFILFLFLSVGYALLSYVLGAAGGMALNIDPHSCGLVVGALSVVKSAVGAMSPGLAALSMSVPGVRAMTPQRALLQEIQYLNESVYGLTNAKELPGYIRSEVQLGITNSIDFAIGTNEQANGQVVQPFENRLNINDAFYITHFGVMFYTAAATTAARSVARLETFPNFNVFGAVNPAVAGAYNGKLALRVDDTVYIDSMDMLRFQNVQSAQKGQALSTVALTGITDASAWSQNEMFAHSVDPLVRLNGPGKNKFTVTLPDNLTFTGGANPVYAVLYLRGWLSQNGGGFRATNAPANPYGA